MRGELVNAWTARGRAAGPLIHASQVPPVPYSRTGSTYVAICGTQVRNVTREPFTPAGAGRRCPTCVKESLR